MPGLYENIHKRRKSGKKMRKKGDPGAPTEQDFKDAAKTAKPIKQARKDAVRNALKKRGS